MLKRKTVFFLFMTLAFSTLSSQTIVSTSPSNKRVVLEGFGGIYCIYCPDGHQIIETLHDTLSNELVVINYQNGPYAIPIGEDPDLGNSYGDDLADAALLSGYPAATINRHYIEGLSQQIGGTAISRSHWEEAAWNILEQIAPVNIAMEASIDISTRMLSVHIEYYYTSDATLPNNRLHLAILQNNVRAPQHGAYDSPNYLHQSLFRDYITGPTGHIINHTSTGSFGSLTYEVELPSFYRDIRTDPINIELAAFISEDHQNILNGVSTHPTLTASAPNDINVLSVDAPDDICNQNLHPSITIRNDGHEPLTFCIIEYGLVNGDITELTWTGYIEPQEEGVIDLPELTIQNNSIENVFHANFSNPNHYADPSLYNNQIAHHFTQAPFTNDNHLQLVLLTDSYGYETYWEVINDNNTVYAFGGNEVVGMTNGGAQIAQATNPTAYPNNYYTIEDIELPSDGCYQLRILDDYSDGMCCQYGNGSYRLMDSNGDILLQGGVFRSLDERYFHLSSEVTSSTHIATPSPPVVAPNPTRQGQNINIHWAAAPPLIYDWELVDLTGKFLQIGNDSNTPNSSLLKPGLYYLRISHDNTTYNLPVVIHP